MEKETKGRVVSVKKQWWMKVNTKAFRAGPMDGAVFPYIVKVSYRVDGQDYAKRKWIGPGRPVPREGDEARVFYDSEKPARATIRF